ncbi:MAG: signal peptide peptidase SppA [Proteobacteria bacterium]|nr:signal peptide peptidase SppA [Pseudomonadota bacterium]
MKRLVGAVLIALVAAMFLLPLYSPAPEVPDGGILVLELEGRIEETPALDPLAQFVARGPALPSLLLLLDMAAADERIEQLVVRVRPLDCGYARLQELRAALRRVRDAGKRVIAVLDLATLNATREYYLASAADRIYVDPGHLGPVAGIAGQYLHLGGLFERLGVAFEYERVGQYKSAVEGYASREMSAPAREMTEAIFDGLYARLVDDIAEGRGLSRAEVAERIDRAPGTARELVDAGLADGIAGASEIFERAGLDAEKRVDAADYRRVSPTSLGLRFGPKIAMVFGDGAIVQSGSGPFSPPGFATDRVSEAIEEAVEDPEVRAIVLRVNSGGGSALASDQLWRTLMRAREDKPVVVSMGDAAASGGYYVASGADAIVSGSATLTGSIGVFVLRASLAGVYEKLDIGSEVISRGRYASVMGGDQPLTPEQRERTADYVQAAYRGFLDRIHEGRGADPEEVDRVGQGRVWLGGAAHDLGLVDRIGGLHEAVELAKQKADIAADVDPERVVYPGPRGFFEQLSELMSADAGSTLRQLLLPLAPPQLPDWLWFPLEGELAYLPTHWVEIR